MKQTKPTVDQHGTKRWLNEKGELHRLDGPAFIRPSGYVEWRVNDKPHRLDGPAVEWSNGDREWWVDGHFHRLDGPAYEGVNGFKGWWINDKELTKEQFEQHPLVIFYRLSKGTTI
jgi:hypothetical protein